jgi:hypothetical protein
MLRPIRILLQTTIPTTEDDWSIERFSLLRDYLMNYAPLLRGRARFCSAPIGDVFLTFLLG